MNSGVFWAFITCKAVNTHGIPFFYNMFKGRIFKYCHHTINFPIVLRTNARYFEGYIFHLQTWTFFFLAFVCSLGLLLPDSKFLLAAELSVCQIMNCLLVRHSGGDHKVKYLLPVMMIRKMGRDPSQLFTSLWHHKNYKRLWNW